MKYTVILEIDIKPDEIIGAKEQIAAALEDIGGIKIIEIKESRGAKEN